MGVERINGSVSRESGHVEEGHEQLSGEIQGKKVQVLNSSFFSRASNWDCTQGVYVDYCWGKEVPIFFHF